MAVDIHVSTGGGDGGRGTEKRPLGTIQDAQKAARAMIARGLKEPVNVLLHGGAYFLDAPLVLTPEDSGTEEYPITWRAVDGERVLLSGGIRIPGPWTRTDLPGIWAVALPKVADDWNFRQLFVDGKRATRARFPNADEANPFLYATGGGMDHAVIDPALIKDSWGKGRDVQINIVPAWKFFNQWNTVTGVDPEAGRIQIADSEQHGKIQKGNWFWIEGVKEELDQPGEWFLDRDEARLYYMPEPGVDPNGLEVVAPRLNVLVYAKGDVEAGTHVEHVGFHGLEFRHTTFTLGQIEARVDTDATIKLENANHFRVEGCHFENIGGYALWLHLDSQYNDFDGNSVLDSGGGGVLFTGARLSYMDDSKVYTPGEKAAKVFPILNRVTRNTVKHCGRLRYYGGGVHLDSRPACMAMEPGNYIAHNTFEDLSRNGIFGFRNQGGNIIEYNHIHDAMKTTIDGACIHLATMNHLNAPNFILNNWLHDIWGYEQKPDGRPQRHLANGIFLDWATSNTTVKNNIVYNAGGEPIKCIMGNWNCTMADNQTAENRIVPPFVDEVGPGGTATHGIDLERNRLIGSVIHYSEDTLVTRSGSWEQRRITGLSGLFCFHLLQVGPDEHAEITYAFPIVEDGTYQISLLYWPDPGNASNARVQIRHADGVESRVWNMQEGDRHGFAVEVGRYPFRANQPASITISNEDANGAVVADSVAFVKLQ